ncbi:DUF1294 domain-containing protein [Chryseobacterium sp. PTM-20240506]|uniref:DUF1294 domain-containing protein n=1 Tax=unclassified Chryseobacterium TaxID=2593645 RepID=UPI00358E5CE8
MMYYLLAINIVCFFIFGIDKRKAKMHQRRISENTLLALALFGGSVGGIFGIFIFRHKISKKSFLLRFCAVLVIQMVLVYFFRKYR